MPALHGHPVARKVLFCPRPSDESESRRISNKRIRFCVLDVDGTYLEVFQVISDTFIEAAAEGASTEEEDDLRQFAVENVCAVQFGAQPSRPSSTCSYGGNLRVLDCDWLSSDRLCLLVLDTPASTSSSSSSSAPNVQLRVYDYAMQRATGELGASALRLQPYTHWRTSRLTQQQQLTLNPYLFIDPQYSLFSCKYSSLLLPLLAHLFSKKLSKSKEVEQQNQQPLSTSRRPALLQMFLERYRSIFSTAIDGTSNDIGLLQKLLAMNRNLHYSGDEFEHQFALLSSFNLLRSSANAKLQPHQQKRSLPLAFDFLVDGDEYTSLEADRLALQEHLLLARTPQAIAMAMAGGAGGVAKQLLRLDAANWRSREQLLLTKLVLLQADESEKRGRIIHYLLDSQMGDEAEQQSLNAEPEWETLATPGGSAQHTYAEHAYLAALLCAVPALSLALPPSPSNSASGASLAPIGHVASCLSSLKLVATSLIANHCLLGTRTA